METISDARRDLVEIEQKLHPALVHERAVQQLDRLFSRGRAPRELDGMLRGRLITTSIWSPLDRAGLNLARLYMPWLGKSFDSARSTGVNVLRPNAQLPLKLVAPGYRPERVLADRIEAFPFRTRIAGGEVDPSTEVCKIGYDFDPNPKFVRRILDELVELDDGVYLGKILWRGARSWRRIGFFALDR